MTLAGGQPTLRLAAERERAGPPAWHPSGAAHAGAEDA